MLSSIPVFISIIFGVVLIVYITVYYIIHSKLAFNVVSNYNSITIGLIIASRKGEEKGASKDRVEELGYLLMFTLDPDTSIF